MAFNRFKSLVLFSILFPIYSWAFQLDWSGYYLGKVYYDYNLSEKISQFAVEQYMLMDSVARVSDGLSVNSRLLLGFNKPATFGFSRTKNFIHSSNTQIIQFNPVYFYTRYNNEFVQLEFGRMPFDFGLGLTYSSGDHFLEPAYDVRDGVSIKIEYDSFYVKPYGIVYFKEQIGDQEIGTGRDFSLALEVGYKEKGLEIGALHKTKIMNSFNDLSSFENSPYRSESTTNVFGHYDYEPFSFSAEWGSQEEWNQHAGVLQADWKTKFHSLVVSLVGAYVTEDYVANANWNPSFILWDYFYFVLGETSEGHSLGLNDSIVISPSLNFDLMDNFNVRLVHIWITNRSNKNMKNHELQTVLTYDSKKGLKWENKFGFILIENRNRVAARSSAVVHF